MLYGSNPNADLMMMLDTTASSVGYPAYSSVMEVGGGSCSHGDVEEKSSSCGTRTTTWTPPYSNTNSHDEMSSSLSTMDQYNTNSAVRRVFSAGDLHNEYWNDGEMRMMMRKRAESPSMSTSESCSSIIESMSKASKYSPLEKQQRILRYRTKRNLRNFSKKIKYECRKTLADSRPRIRGRFARNDELDNISVTEHVQTNNNTTWSSSNSIYDGSSGQQDQQQQQFDHDYPDDDDDNYWVHFLNASHSSFP
ncbi:Zinc finger protein CONSTANS-LIKE 1 [Linum grandiflorum]